MTAAMTASIAGMPVSVPEGMYGVCVATGAGGAVEDGSTTLGGTPDVGEAGGVSETSAHATRKTARAAASMRNLVI
jgi:hypothetical protein